MNFNDVIDILDRSVGGPDADVSSHGPFWRGVTRDRFIAMKVGGRKLVTLGDGANSNLVKSLQGVAPFGSDLQPLPEGATVMRMPAYLDPVSDEEIARVVQWIDEGCPEG
jgi:hypothetical protein